VTVEEWRASLEEPVFNSGKRRVSPKVREQENAMLAHAASILVG